MSHCVHAFILLHYFHYPSLFQHNVQLFKAVICLYMEYNRYGWIGCCFQNILFILY